MQQQGGDQDQLPPDFSSFLYPVEVPDATPNQMNPAVADQGLDTAVNKVSDPSPDQVPKPNSSGTYCVEENAPNEQSWSQACLLHFIVYHILSCARAYLLDHDIY